MELTEDSLFEGERIRTISEEGQSSAAPSPTAPVVVIEYRQNGLGPRVLPAILVLLAAIAISSFQRRTPVRLIPNRSMLVAPAPAITAPATADPPIIAKFADAKELDPNLTKTASKTPRKTLAAADKPWISPFEIDPSDGLKPVEVDGSVPATHEPDDPVLAEENPSPRVAAPEAFPSEEIASAPKVEVPRSEPTKDDILNEIRREAAEKEAERQRLDDLKPQAKALVLAESIERAQSDRQPFHDSLKQMIQTNDPELYLMVDNLCNRYGRSLNDELKARYFKAQRLFPKRMTKQAEVLAMRKLGLPEPMILDFLVNKSLKTINSRSGPANAREAVIAASKQLLAIGLNFKDAAGKPASPKNPAATSTIATGGRSIKKP